MVLLTGCAGFIASHVAEVLIAQGQRVLGIDNLSDAYDVRLKDWRLARLRELSDFSFARLDVTNFQALKKLFASQTFSAVVHLAARAGVRQSINDPWVYAETNIAGTLNLLELCKDHGVKKLVLASTSSLYGAGPQPFREDQPTDGPLSPYAATKKAAELLCHTYHHLYGLDVSVLRYFTVYGPAGRPDMSIFRFIRWIAEGEPIQLYGNGSQRRDFTFVGDIARGTALALRPLGYEIINLGSDRPASLNDVIAMLEGLLNKQAKARHLAPQPTDVPATWADISKATRILGWTPKIPLEEGLRQSVAWYEENRQMAQELKLT